jgi:putative ABC transport system permease protein
LFIRKSRREKSEFVLRETLSMAFYNLSRRKMRTGLTLLGIIVGIGAVVALISLGNGMEAAISDALESFGPNKIYIASNFGSGFGGIGFGESLTDDDLEKVRNVGGVKNAVGMSMKSLPVEYKEETKILPIIGVNPKDNKMFFSEIQSFKLSQGRFLESGEKNTVVAGYLIEKDTFSEDVKLRSKFTIKDREFRVVGFFESLGNPQDDSQIYIPLDTLREISGGGNELVAMMAEAEENPSEVAKEIEDVLDKAHHGEDLFMAMTAEQVQEQIGSIFGVMSIALGGIASISLLVAGFGIMNTMLMSVLERTREIGIMKAIGATNVKIMTVFLVETAAIGFIGGVIGILFGSGLYLGISYAATNFLGFKLAMFISPSLMIMALLFSMFVGILSGLYPAWRASKLNPVEALRYE